MARFKLVALGLLAALAISAMGASSAFAAGEWHGSALTLPETISGEGGAQLLESVIATQKVLIKCTKNKGTGTIRTLGKAEGELTFEGCVLWTVNGTTHVAEESKVCAVSPPVAKISGQLEAGNTLVVLKASGTNFTEIKITGSSCVAKGTFAVTGEQTCSGPEGMVALVTHVLNCNAEATSLKLGTEPARLTGELKVSLSGADSGGTWWGE
jgi:hypothetical protein